MINLNQQIFYFLFYLPRQHQWLKPFVIFCAEYLPYLMILAVLYLGYKALIDSKRKLSKQYLYTLLIGSVGIIIAKIIQYFYIMHRPFVKFELEPLFRVTSYSFPSAHAMGTFALAMGIYLIDKKAGRLFFVMAVFVSIARVMGGVHYPFDVFAGAIFGMMVAYGMFGLMKFRR